MAEYREAALPPNPGPRDHVLRVRAGEEHCFISCSPALWGVWTHWIAERTEPCIVPKAECRGCQKQAPLRWKGYLHVYDTGTKLPCFLELTPVVAKDLLTLASPNADLRGLSFRISRGRGGKAHLRVAWAGGRYNGTDLPEARDPKDVLTVLWQMPNRKARFADAREQSTIELGTAREF